MTTLSTSQTSLLKKREEELKDIERARRAALERPTQSPTLLWKSAAHTITFATGVGTWWVQASAGAARWGLSAGRQATHGLISLNHTALETILRATVPDPEMGVSRLRAEQAETMVERWVSALHETWTAASVFAAGGFFIAENAVNWSTESSLYGLHFLNALFGSTETSRAVAAVVELMRKELNKPQDGGTVNQVRTYELLTTVTSFLFLQRSGRRQTELDWRASGGDATIWDVVLDDRGFRGDVLSTRRPETVVYAADFVQSPTVERSPEGAAIAPLEGHGSDAQPTVSPTNDVVRQSILCQLPPGSQATITSYTKTEETIRVDIRATANTNIEAPPGMVMVSEHPNFDNSSDVQTVVFRRISNVVSKAEINPADGELRTVPADVDEGDVVMQGVPTRALLTTAPGASMNTTENAPATVDDVEAEHDVDANQGIADATTANQGKSRRTTQQGSSPPSARQTQPRPSNAQRERMQQNSGASRSGRPGVFRRALHSLSPTQSSTAMNRMMPGSSRNRSNSTGGFSNSLSQTLRPLTSQADSSRRPIFTVPHTQPTTPLMSPGSTTPTANEGSSTSYFTIHEQRRESTYSQTDTYSVHSNESRPPSPTMSRTHLRASNSMSKTHSQTNISFQHNTDDPPEQSNRHHHRSRSFVPTPSLYSMGTKNSAEDAFVFVPRAPLPRPSIFEDNKMIQALKRDGIVPGQFPRRHLVWTLRRFGRFASAVYGENFLKWMGLPLNPEQLRQSREIVKKDVHYEHLSFAMYTGLPEETIIKSSYLEPQGFHFTHDEGFTPLIHFVTIDLESKAIVLCCRGTLGFEDLLTDAACDYADLYWQGHQYQVHRGIRDAARRLMDNRGGNHIMSTLKAALEEYPEFGLILVGHSLGGAVAAMLAIMLAEPSKHEPGEEDKPSFVTAVRPKLLPSKEHAARLRDIPPVTLPAGRPIQVYSFGSPACVTPALRLATRGLITTIINANDIIPYLSLGTLHDFKAIAKRLKDDVTSTYKSVAQRATERMRRTLLGQIWETHPTAESMPGPPPASDLAGDGLGEDAWMWHELCEMRKVMTNEKLLPPGEIFVLENTRVFDRTPDESTTEGVNEAKEFNSLGRPATRIQLKYVKDVEKRFSEIRFTRTMFAEHTPYNYEKNLSALERGVYDEAL